MRQLANGLRAVTKLSPPRQHMGQADRFTFGACDSELDQVSIM